MQHPWFCHWMAPCAALVLASCAAQQTSTETPEAAPTEEKSEASEEASSEAEPAEEQSAEEQDPNALGKPVSEILTSEGVAYTFDYGASEMKEKHQKTCEPSAKGDPGKLASCLERQRKGFYSDVLWFHPDPETGELTWLVYKSVGSKLTEVYRRVIEFEDEQPHQVTMKLKSGARGVQQICTGQSSITIEVPDKYGLVIDDPKYGKLKYRSKLDLVQAPKPTG